MLEGHKQRQKQNKLDKFEAPASKHAAKVKVKQEKKSPSSGEDSLPRRDVDIRLTPRVKKEEVKEEVKSEDDEDYNYE